jgi:outer membrane protein, heavy metal efflux system
MNKFTNMLMTLVILGSGVFLFFPLPSQASTIFPVPLPLADIISEGLANNQGLKSQAAKVDAMKAEAMAAGALDDPGIGFGLLNLPVDTFSFTQEPMTQKQISVVQKFPWPGKLSLKSQSAALVTLREVAILKEKKLNLAKTITTTYYDMSFVGRSLETNERLSQMVRRLLRTAETRYSVGKGLQQDVLSAQVELSRLLDESISLKQKHRTLENRINGLLGRTSFSPVPMPENLTLPEGVLSIDDLTKRGLKSNTGILIRLLDIDTAKIDVALARKSYFPDFDVKLAYGQREEDRMGNDLADFASASVMMRIPLWKHKKQDNRLIAAKKRLEAKEAAHRDLSTGLPFKIESLAEEIMGTRENYRLFNEGILVQAGQWARASESAYQVNKIEFNTMITAQVRLFRLRLMRDKYLHQIHKQEAQLKELIGEIAVRAIKEEDVK